VFISPTLITDLAVQSRNDAIEKVNWYAMRWKIEGIDDRTVHLTVPTKFLKGCIQVRVTLTAYLRVGRANISHQS
jgi:hypothetical protein